jgi:hypothetical protein
MTDETRALLNYWQETLILLRSVEIEEMQERGERPYLVSQSHQILQRLLLVEEKEVVTAASRVLAADGNERGISEQELLSL